MDFELPLTLAAVAEARAEASGFHDWAKQLWRSSGIGAHRDSTLMGGTKAEQETT